VSDFMHVFYFPFNAWRSLANNLAVNLATAKYPVIRLDAQRYCLTLFYAELWGGPKVGLQ